ncbi:UbiH/UbiF family hydroxylase [Paracoccus sp. P2]|uniref:UbiH/UbiF family hydroxylase n=1 Tax=Paracoccus pantotrophus TaxID=82367 RepID=A0A7H9BRL7_PARPN|nr:UbiH/UbiF family hydroxylase [Paracoccus pantotrophus]MDF3855705.1 UbiH/UbiF family hydroxylase [Paracoccus pantotrophus]QLH13626.1 UbiH/UbiF family hydroxylase [Paracoccus pantotrophus]RDD99568.1 UbiH/UbiF family hydroxylase [Paracoccus pantotrophus]RNI17090.1 UbiH/UbiF family hydroxylase [Paracoccus pantotrophus]WGR67211.1 UbiH/UbiF family hydroxylase [Paracoccus pantotrophus]
MQIDDTEILVSGGGIAGLIAAAAFGSAGHSVTCVDPASPVTEEGAQGSDLRSTAFLHPSIAVLQAAGLWDRLAPHATALQVMRIIDAGGKLSQARLTRDFDASEISDQPFGWNLPNWLLKREISARLASLQNVRFLPGTGTAGLVARDSEALATLTDGSRIRARLVIGADGRNSPTREALGIGIRTLRYGQKALAFAVTHDRPHDNVSTEIHRSGGPFTLVPLPDRDGKPSSAVVWMERGPETARLRALPPEDFEAELNRRSAGVLGHLTQATRLTEWPIISQIADRFTGPRTALIAEAAHVVPPIGAQGLNMSLADLGALIALSAGDPGSADSLAAYERRRRPEALARLIGIDALNRASMISARPLRDLRAAALGGLYAVAPVRRIMMRAGLGVT